MPKRPKLKCKARTWEASASTLSGVRSPANSTLPPPASPEGIAAVMIGIGIEIICGASTAEELVTLLENANPQEEDPEIETAATEETAEEADLEEADLEEEETDQDPEIETDHPEDTGTTPENIEEEIGIETIAEIEVEIGIETVIDREITTAEIEERQDPDDLARGPIHVPQLRQDEREDQEVEIRHHPKSLKMILEETTRDERETPLLIEMKRTAQLTKIKRKKPPTQKERRAKQELTVTKLITCPRDSRKTTRLTKLIEEIGEAERMRI